MLLIKARGLPAAELRHKPAHQVVSESGAVGHLDEEAVGSSVECLEMSNVMAMVLLGGLCWLKPETTLAEMGSRAEAVECLGLKPCWEGIVPSSSTMDRRRSRFSIFTAGQSIEASLPSRSEL